MCEQTDRTVTSERLGESYRRIRHRSGLTIYVFPKAMTTTYALLATHYGSLDNRFRLADETADTQMPEGIAHFLEHKMFTAEDGSDAFDVFARYGADANAYTSYDKTVFLFSCTDHAEDCLAELLRFVMHPYFTAETVAKEQGIIAQEIGMYEDSPATRSYYGMLRGLYHACEIRQNICGSVDSIARITPEMLYRCHRVFYRLSNMALVVCGQMTAEQVLAQADRWLPAEAPQESAIVRHRPEEPRTVCRARVTDRMQLAKPVFTIGIKDPDVPSTPDGRAKRDVMMSLLNDLLFSETGALYQDLYQEGLLSPGASASYTISEDFAFHVLAGYSEEPETVLARVQAYVRRKKEEGFTREEFERCRKVFYASFVREFDSTDDIANNLLTAAFDGDELFAYTDRLFALTYEETMTAFQTAFDEEAYTLSAVYPLDDTRGRADT